jgi:hypothetical protein
MAGYRDTSSFDPFGAATRPARPFNWVQWTGVALLMVSVGLNLAFLAGQAGWLPKWNFTPTLATAPMIFGVVLMNSRREPVQDPAPELAPARRRWLLGTIVVVSLILLTATIVDAVTGK